MPRFRPSFPGIAAVLALSLTLVLAGACGPSAARRPQPSPSPTATPTVLPTTSIGAGNAPWALNLDLGGDLSAHVTGTAPSDDTLHNECTGIESGASGSWASTMVLTVNQQRYALVVLVPGYKGAGTFTSGVQVELSTEDQSKVWQNGSGDSVSFTVGPDETSGLLDAVLSNAKVTANKVDISGHWSCQP